MKIANMNVGLPMLAFFSGTLCLLCSLVLLAVVSACDSKRNYGRPVLALSIAAFVCFSCFYGNFTVDDTYISLRYARNLAHGHGLVFSTDGSPPVEGYTNFLLIVAEAPLFLLDLSTPVILDAVKAIGIGFGVGVVILTYCLTHLITNDQRAASISAIFTSAIPNLAFWAVGGLETTMYIFWLLAGLCVRIQEDRRGLRHPGSMVLFTLLALTRPEGLFFALAILCWDCAAAVYTGGGGKSVVKYVLPDAAILVLLYGSYFCWRYQYYGFLLPNTFYARSGGVNLGQVVRRLFEMEPFVTYLLPFLAVACVGWCLHAGVTTHRKVFLTMTFVVLFAFSFASKREWMPGFRYELPMVPILLVFFSAGMSHLLNGVKLGQMRGLGLELGVLLCAGLFTLSPAIALRNAGTNNERLLASVQIRLGQWLKLYARWDASFAGWDLGAVPYYSEIPNIIEIHPEGILSTHTTHIGYDPRYVLSLHPSFLVLPPEKLTRDSQNSMQEFYTLPELRREYRLLATLEDPGTAYVYRVYCHESVTIPQRAVNELQTPSRKHSEL